MSLDSLKISTAQRARLEASSRRYEGSMDAPTAHYLMDRGIDKAAALRFRLGLVVDPIVGHEQYEGRLSIPYLTSAGVVAIKFRDLTGSAKQKYMGLGGQQPRLYNVSDLFHPKNLVAICEGEVDTIIMSSMVGVPAVGVAGGNAWLKHFPRCFADIARVFIVMDNDLKDDGSNPGQVFVRKIAQTLHGAVVVTPPEGLDVNEWYLKEGAETIRKALGITA